MQVLDSVVDFFASVRIGDIGALFQLFHKMNGRGVAVFTFDKRLVFSEIQTVGIVDQRISGNARCGLICLGNAAVNDKQLALRLDRAFSVFDPDRHMSVDNMSLLRVKPEVLQQRNADIGVFRERISHKIGRINLDFRRMTLVLLMKRAICKTHIALRSSEL